jgi:hypothetical protein
MAIADEVYDEVRRMRDRTGNLPIWYPSDYLAPIVRTGADRQRELVMARWGRRRRHYWTERAEAA